MPGAVLILAAALATVAGATAGDAALSPAQLLAQMGQAVRELNYVGTLVYVQGDSIETLELVHRVAGGKIGDRLTTVSGAQREVVGEGESVRFYLGDERVVRVEGRGARSALPRVLPADAAALAAQYRLVDQGPSSAAGRACRMLSIAPRDAWRYGYRLCLDAATGLPLRTEVLADDGKRVVEQVVFTAVAFPVRIGDAELRPRSDAKDWTWHVRDAGPAAAPGPTRIIVNALPAGFVASSSIQDLVAAGRAEGEHLSFSDGLASISVFVEPADATDRGLDGAARMGATNLYGRLLGAHQITVVGEVPATTVRAIADAIALRVEKRSTAIK